MTTTASATATKRAQLNALATNLAERFKAIEIVKLGDGNGPATLRYVDLSTYTGTDVTSNGTFATKLVFTLTQKPGEYSDQLKSITAQVTYDVGPYSYEQFFEKPYGTTYPSINFAATKTPEQVWKDLTRRLFTLENFDQAKAVAAYRTDAANAKASLEAERKGMVLATPGAYELREREVGLRWDTDKARATFNGYPYGSLTFGSDGSDASLELRNLPTELAQRVLDLITEATR